MHTYIYKYICYNKIEIYFFSVIFLKFSSFRFTPILYAAANYLQRSKLISLLCIPLMRSLTYCEKIVGMLIANFFFSFSPSFSFFSFFKSRTTYTARAPFPPPSPSLANKILLCTTFEGHAQQTCEIRAYARVYRRNKELCNICVFTYSVRVYGFSSARRSSKSPPSLALALSLSATARLRRMNTVWNRFVNEMGWRCIAVQLPLSLSLPLPPPSLLSFDRSS